MNQAEFIAAALSEDIGPGDYSTLSSIPADLKGKATLKIKEDGVIAGLQLAEAIPPAYTEHLGRQLITHIETRSAA